MNIRVTLTVLAAALIVTTHSFAETLETRLANGPLAGAHQGGVLHLDGNTMGRFKSAVKSGVDLIETDLRVTSDGIPVIFHDKSLNLWTNCHGAVKKKTFSKIKKCHFTLNGEKIPSFEELLIANQKWNVIINAEFKDSDVISPALELVRKYNAYENVYFQTKSKPALYEQARALDPYVALLFKATSQERLDWILSLNDPRLLVIELEDKMLSKKMINQIHAAGKFTSANSFEISWNLEILRASCDRLFKKGIDIAISNRTADCVRQAEAARLR